MTKQLRIPEGDLKLLKSLQRHAIPFVIIGGHAVRFHGVERGVGDLDVAVDSVGRVEELNAVVIEALGYTPKAKVAEYGMPYKLINLTNNGMNSDILTSIRGVEFAEAYQAAHVVEVEGVTVRVISKEQLILNKRAAVREPGREKDLQGVELLEALA